MNQLTSPISIFVYKRPEHTQRTLKSLARNVGASKSDVIVYSDGFKSKEDETGVRQVRELIRLPEWMKSFGTFTVIERRSNLGLATSIISGLNETFKNHPSTIVLEDDIETHPRFLEYMNAGLDFYNDHPNVGSINSWMRSIIGLPQFMLIPGGDCWGWATWRKKWKLFEPDSAELIRLIRGHPLRKRLEKDWINLLIENERGNNDSWHIRWLISQIINDQYGLFPGKSMIRNIGMDGSGTHFKTSIQVKFDSWEEFDSDFSFPLLSSPSNGIAYNKIRHDRLKKRMLHQLSVQKSLITKTLRNVFQS